MSVFLRLSCKLLRNTLNQEVIGSCLNSRYRNYNVQVAGLLISEVELKQDTWQDISLYQRFSISPLQQNK